MSKEDKAARNVRKEEKLRDKAGESKTGSQPAYDYHQDKANNAEQARQNEEYVRKMREKK